MTQALEQAEVSTDTDVDTTYSTEGLCGLY